MNPEAYSIDETSLPLATSDSVLQSRAWHLYALYRLRNALRHHTVLSGDLAGAYHQYFREAQLALAI